MLGHLLLIKNLYLINGGEMTINFINSSVEEIKQTNLLKHIELCGRVCYKSEDKITDDSAEKFVRNIVSRGHTSVLEHGTVYLVTPYELQDADSIWGKIQRSPYKVISEVRELGYWGYLTTNFRVVVDACDGDLDRALEFIEANRGRNFPTDRYIKRRTFRITCDRGVSHELVRHRVMSFSQESTRYVNSTKRGFLFIKPAWWNDELLNNPQFDPNNSNELKKHSLFKSACMSSAQHYSDLIDLGQTPQQARAVLPNALKTEVVMTGTSLQWEAFLELRTAPSAHPDMQIIANMIKERL